MEALFKLEICFVTLIGMKMKFERTLGGGCDQTQNEIKIIIRLVYGNGLTTYGTKCKTGQRAIGLRIPNTS
jgi:hypothetical protein